jgi:hypothetical protein
MPIKFTHVPHTDMVTADAPSIQASSMYVLVLPQAYDIRRHAVERGLQDVRRSFMNVHAIHTTPLKSTI